MNLQEIFRARRTSDAKVIEHSREIVRDFNDNPKECEISISWIGKAGTNTSYWLTEPVLKSNLHDILNHPIFLHAKEHNGSLWAQIHISFSSGGLSFTLDRYHYTKLPERLHDDEITLDYGRQDEDTISAERCLEADRAFGTIQNYFAPFNHAAAIEQALGPEFAEHYSRRDEELSRLENLAQRITEDTHGHRKKLDAEYEERKKELNQSIRERKMTLEHDHNRRRDELSTREEELEKLRKDLDDRTARHARREQSRNLQKKISTRSEKFTLTRDTQRKRLPVHCIFAGLLAVTATLIVLSQISPARATDGLALWLEVIRLPIGTLGFVFTAIFYIRWTDHWFRQHADQEFRLQQLALDVDRAGYATEMLLEWHEDKDGEMPAVMVDRLTTGLFLDQTKTGQVQHPTEDITDKLLKAASSVDVDIPGIGRATLRGRKLKNLDKD